MALWANTADGWGSDASKNGNGALGTYLQTSLASAPKSPSEKQAGDPTNTMPTSSISRMAQPAVSRAAVATTPQTVAVATPATTTAQALTGGVIARGGGDVSQDTINNGQGQNWASVVDPTKYAKQASAGGYSGGINTYVDKDTYADTKAIAAATPYAGPQMIKVKHAGNDPGYQYFKWNPQFQNYMSAGISYAWEGGIKYELERGTTADQYQDVGSLDDTQSRQGIVGASNYIAQKFSNEITQSRQQYNAGLSAERLKNLTSYYGKSLYETGQLPSATVSGSPGGQSLDPTDQQARTAALSAYAENKRAADTFKAGVTDVDTSQQDAINQSSIAALASRYSTNISKGNVGSMGRLYASALSAQSGVNEQLSDEAYATGFNRNLANFNQAVQNQATLDSNATGMRLQSDITAMGDVVSKLQQQVKQIGTASGNQVNEQLMNLQQQINDYKAAASKYGADTDEIVKWGKAIVGAAVGITAIALAPVTVGASVAGGAALGAAVLKA